MKVDAREAETGSPAADGLPQVAIGWLREILRSEFAAEPEILGEPRASSQPGGFCRAEWLRLASRIRVLGFSDLHTGLAGPAPLAPVLDRAWGVVEHAEPLTLVAIGVVADSAEESAQHPALCAVLEALREEAASCGIVLQCGALELTVVLPQVDAPQAEALIARTRERLGSRRQFHAGIASHTPEIASVQQLLTLSTRALAAARG